MKYLLSLLAAGICTLNAQQSWGWIRTANGTSDESAAKLCTDNSGNVIVAGNFNSASAVLTGSNVNNSGTGLRDIFIAKYGPLGNLLWVRSAGGNGEDEVTAICCDAADNVYVGGQYDSGTMNFGSTGLNNTSGFTDLFLAKYDASGALQWAKSFGGNLSETMTGLTSAANAIYFAGTFRSLSVNFGNFGVISSGGADAFVAKCDAAGTALWAKQIGGTQDDLAQDLAADNSGNVGVCGHFNSSTLSSYSLSSNGSYDIFIGRYDASGNLLASRVVGGPQAEYATALQCDPSGNLVLAGNFSSPSLNLSSVTLNNTSGSDMVLLKMNASLQTTWAKNTNGSALTFVNDIYCDAAANIYLAGQFDLSALPLGAINLQNSGAGLDGFAATLDGGGSWLNALSTGSSGDEVLSSSAMASNGNYFMCGYYTTSLTLGVHSATNTGGKDLFLAQRCDVPQLPQVVASVSVCSGMPAVLTATAPAGASVNWYAGSTSTVLATSATFTVNSSGTWYAGSQSVYSGCTSNTRLAVIVSVQPAPTVAVNGGTLVTGNPGTYQWISCQTRSLIAGQTSPTLQLQQSGYYAVIVTSNGCKDTSACRFYSVDATTGTVTVPPDTVRTGITEIALLPLKIYPNPARESIFVEWEIPQHIHISDLSGRVMYTHNLTEEKGLLPLQLPGPGLYILSSSSGFRKRIVVSP